MILSASRLRCLLISFLASAPSLWDCNKILSASRSSPSPRQIATKRLITEVISTSGWIVSSAENCIGWGLAQAFKTSSGAINFLTLSCSCLKIISCSSSEYKSILLNTNSDRLPIVAKASKGLNSDALKSLSQTKINKSAEVANSLANCSLIWPGAPISKIPGVSVINISRLT